MADASGLRDRVRRYGVAVAEEAGQQVVAALVEAAPERSGETKRQISWTAGGSPDRPGGTVKAPAPGGEFVEAGTSPHVILPRSASVLVFQVGGETVFARRVNHPGSPARPWFRPTVERWGEFLQRAAGSVNV